MYPVSQITEVFEPLRENDVTGTTILLYIAVFIGFISSWNIQTVYFNRFGEHNFKDIISMTVLQMPILLFMAQHAYAQSYEEFRLFSYGLFALSLVDIAQYAWIAIEKRGTADARDCPAVRFNCRRDVDRRHKGRLWSGWNTHPSAETARLAKEIGSPAQT